MTTNDSTSAMPTTIANSLTAAPSTASPPTDSSSPGDRIRRPVSSPSSPPAPPSPSVRGGGGGGGGGGQRRMSWSSPRPRSSRQRRGRAARSSPVSGSGWVAGDTCAGVDSSASRTIVGGTPVSCDVLRRAACGRRRRRSGASQAASWAIRGSSVVASLPCLGHVVPQPHGVAVPVRRSTAPASTSAGLRAAVRRSNLSQPGVTVASRCRSRLTCARDVGQGVRALEPPDATAARR